MWKYQSKTRSMIRSAQQLDCGAIIAWDDKTSYGEPRLKGQITEVHLGDTASKVWFIAQPTHIEKDGEWVREFDLDSKFVFPLFVNFIFN